MTLKQFKSKIKKYISQIEDISDSIKALSEEINEEYDCDKLATDTCAFADNILLLITEGEDLSLIEPNGIIDNINEDISEIEDSLNDIKNEIEE